MDIELGIEYTPKVITFALSKHNLSAFASLWCTPSLLIPYWRAIHGMELSYKLGEQPTVIVLDKAELISSSRVRTFALIKVEISRNLDPINRNILELSHFEYKLIMILSCKKLISRSRHIFSYWTTSHIEDVMNK